MRRKLDPISPASRIEFPRMPSVERARSKAWSQEIPAAALRTIPTLASAA
jgi:hypothetical protein